MLRLEMFFFWSGSNTQLVVFDHGYPTRGSPGSITRPEATFVNYVYIINITQSFRRLGLQVIVVFPPAARELAHIIIG